MSDTKTVFLVDDDSLILETLTWLLESVNYNVISYQSAQSFLDDYKKSYPACLILDVRMQGLSGLELQEKLTEKNINIPIIFMSGYGDVPTSVKSMKKGAFDFLLKPINDQELLEAVNKALRYSEEEFIKKTPDKTDNTIKHLTKREKEVLSFIIAGNPNKMVAKKLCLSINTIEAHRSNIMKKMEANSVADLVRLSIKLGIID